MLALVSPNGTMIAADSSSMSMGVDLGNEGQIGSA
jgi:hypothetical protein